MYGCSYRWSPVDTLHLTEDIDNAAQRALLQFNNIRNHDDNQRRATQFMEYFAGRVDGIVSGITHSVAPQSVELFNNHV